MHRLSLLMPFALAAACALPVRAEFAPYAGQHELLPLYPARPTFGSGTVFRINRSVDGSRYTRVLCRNLFAGITLERTPYSVRDAVYSDPERFGEAVGIVYGLLLSARQTEENLRAQHTRSIKLSYSDATLERLPESIKLDASGTALALDPVCLAALAKLKEQGTLDTIYLVDRALIVNRFRIEIERPADYTLDAMQLLDLNTDFVGHSRGRDAVEIDAPYYIGMNAVTIVDIGPPSAGASPNLRVVKAAPAKLPDQFRSWE